MEEKLAKVDELSKVAKELHATLPQLALAWCAKNPNVSTVIMGATKEAQVQFCLHNPPSRLKVKPFSRPHLWAKSPYPSWMGNNSCLCLLSPSCPVTNGFLLLLSINHFRC